MKDSRHSFKRQSFYSQASTPNLNLTTNGGNASKLRALQDKWDFLESQDVHFSHKRRAFLESFINDLENENSLRHEEIKYLIFIMFSFIIIIKNLLFIFIQLNYLFLS